MILVVALATLITIPLLALITFVQVLYLESLRLRTRDLPALEYFKQSIEKKLAMRAEAGVLSFSVIKNTK